MSITKFLKDKLSKNEQKRLTNMGLTPLEDKIMKILYWEGCFDDMTSKQAIPIVKKVVKEFRLSEERNK